MTASRSGKSYRLAKQRRRRTIWCLLPLLVLCAGCSDGRPPLFAVRGTVTYSSGEPVRQAAIEFVPASPGPSPRGKTDADGHFILSTYSTNDGAPAGEYRVLVVQVLPPRAAKYVRKLGKEHAEHGGKVPLVSLKYASPDTSELAYTVSPTSNHDAKIVVELR